MKERQYPCLCVSCPECGSIFMASALNERYHKDSECNEELLNDVAKYARQGYNVSVLDTSEFKMSRCKHL